jgi:phenylacetate-CoA ligase
MTFHSTMRLPSSLAGGVVYPLQERVFQRPTFSYLSALEGSQRLGRSCVENLQIVKLGALPRVAHAHSPWHRQRMDAAGLRPAPWTMQVWPALSSTFFPSLPTWLAT